MGIRFANPVSQLPFPVRGLGAAPIGHGWRTCACAIHFAWPPMLWRAGRVCVSMCNANHWLKHNRRPATRPRHREAVGVKLAGARQLIRRLCRVNALSDDAGKSLVRTSRSPELRDFSLKTTPPPIPKSCKLGRPMTHVAAVHDLTSTPSLQNARFLLQTRLLCKPAPPSRHSWAFRAHRHRLSAVARKKMYARAQGNVASSEESPN
jgi:hypothetical protein